METLFSALEGVCFLDTRELGFFCEFSALIFRIQTSVGKGNLSLLALSVSVCLSGFCLCLSGDCWKNDCVYMWRPEENTGWLSLSSIILCHILLRQGLPLNLVLNWQPANKGSSPGPPSSAHHIAGITDAGAATPN